LSANASSVVLLADAGPLITLAYADALDLLFKPQWQVRVVDMVLEEVTRNATPNGQSIGRWVAQHSVPIMPTKTYTHYKESQRLASVSRRANLGELAVQEAMHQMALNEPDHTGVFLFEDHKVARATFLVPENSRKVTTRAFLQFLQEMGWIDSAAEVERAAIRQGRNFSQKRLG
jgi:hypothetical protein